MVGRLLAAALAWAASMVGCGSDASRPWRGGSGADGGGASGWGGNPFPAELVSVHPLTRVTVGADGRPRIEAHVEMLDAFGQTTRDVGVMRFELYRGEVGGADGAQRQESVWVVDVSAPVESARQFDRVTRTYVAPLLDAPAWLGQASGGTLVVRFERWDGRVLTGSRRLDR